MSLRDSIKRSRQTGTHQAGQAAAVADRIQTGAPAEDFLILPVTRIRVLPQVRRQFGEDGLRELADDIRANGLDQPIVVRPDPAEEGRYILIAGERRLRCVRDLLGEDTVAAYIKRNIKDQTAAKHVQLSENIQREDLLPFEVAEALSEIKREDPGMTNAMLAKQVHKSESWVAKHLRLLEAPADVQQAVREGRLPATTYFNNPDMFRMGMPRELHAETSPPAVGGTSSAKHADHAKKGRAEHRLKLVSIPEKIAQALLHILEIECKRLKLEPVEIVGKPDSKQLRALLALHTPPVLKKLK